LSCLVLDKLGLLVWCRSDIAVAPAEIAVLVPSYLLVGWVIARTYRTFLAAVARIRLSS
jgi:hypothetical protein